MAAVLSILSTSPRKQYDTCPQDELKIFMPCPSRLSPTSVSGPVHKTLDKTLKNQIVAFPLDHLANGDFGRPHSSENTMRRTLWLAQVHLLSGHPATAGLKCIHCGGWPPRYSFETWSKYKTGSDPLETTWLSFALQILNIKSAATREGKNRAIPRLLVTCFLLVISSTF